MFIKKKIFTNKKGILLMVFPEQRKWGAREVNNQKGQEH